jgi:hypothetical protein
MTKIDEDLEKILAETPNTSVQTGGAKKAKKASTKKVKKASTKKVKKASTKVKKASTKAKKASTKKNSVKVFSEGGIIKNENNASLQQRPRVIKKNADENKEYISVKTEKPQKSDNSYRPYDIAFLKRIQKSKDENNLFSEESDMEQ